uniref:alpha-L-rhamnosidase n=1 Tax=Bionectria ochroleuca TaxID=29856 RepID=A0A0B7KF84_BIOOC
MLSRTLLALTALVLHTHAISIEDGSLKTNGAYNPIDVDTANPRLTWRLESSKRGDIQTSYQIQVSRDENFQATGLWDSGKIQSASTFANYDGESLSSRSSAFWRVKVWDVDDNPSDWSSQGQFEISLLNSDDWTASWITNKDFATGSTSLPVFAKEFEVDCDVSKARLYLLGLGLHVPLINGQTITDEVLQPGYSTVNTTLPYSSYDVTKFLENGDNVLGVELGKGIYDAERPLWGRYYKLIKAYQELRLIAQLEYQCVGDSRLTTITSDDTWKASLDGPYWEASWYGGEEYDARKEVPNWSSRNENGYWVYDLGVNIAGTFRFKMKDKAPQHLAGTRVTFWPDERSNLQQGTTGKPIFNAYTLSNSSSQTYSPKFLYHGFQYLGVNTTWEPSLDDLEGLVIRAANEANIKFSSSSDHFNNIHKIIDRSIQGNMHSVLTDCPHREKLGWLEQNHLVFEPVALGYDIQSYGYDHVRIMADAQAQDVPGLIPDIAPEYTVFGGGYRNDPNWGRAIINVPYQLYQYYGDINVLKTKHQHMVEYLDYLQRRAGGQPYLNDGGLGDWLAIDTKTPKGVASTFGYHQAALYLSKIETILGNDESARSYASLANSILGGFNSMWFNNTIPGSPHYCATTTQACNAFALDMGAVSDVNRGAVLSTLIESIESTPGLFTVGEIALPSLFRVLRAAKRDDILLRWMNSREVPSYGHMIENGATSLWEHWDADTTGGSLNHFMYGYGDLFLLQLSGVSQRNTSVAWNELVFDPIIQGDLSFASTSYTAPSGIVSAKWTLKERIFEYSITIPVGSRGWVYLPATSGIRESGKDLKAGENGIIELKRGCKRTLVMVGSGTYHFEATLSS